MELPNWDTEELEFLREHMRLVVSAEKKAEKDRALAECKGKEGFASKKLADTIHTRMRRRDSYEDGPSDVFKCTTCKKWHIGGKLKRMKLTRRKK